MIAEAVDQIGLDESGYSVFINSLPYRFYPLLAIVLVFAIAFSGRDFGPMRAAERRAVGTGMLASADSSIDPEQIDEELQPKPAVPHRLSNAVVPILVLVGVAMGALFVTGEGDSLRDIIGSADAYGALMYGSLLGVLVAAAMSMAQRLLGLREVVDAWFAGVRSVLFVLIILTLAWALSAITEALNTAGYLSNVLGETLPPFSVPALLFILAAVTSFATGTSWGTMGILMPLTIPLTWAILQANGMTGPEGLPILYAAISTVLAEVDQALARAAGDERPAGVEIDTTAVMGRGAADAILRHRGEADLIVVGSRGHGGFPGLLLGAVSQQVAAHADVPVVVIPHQGETPISGVHDATRKIVVGIDGSRASVQALHWGVHEARKREVPVTAVYAYRSLRAGAPFDAYASIEREQLDALEERAAHTARAKLDDLVAQADIGEAQVDRRVASGPPARVLITEAADESVLLVVGSRGRGGFAGLLLGSVSQQCLHHARGPVVVTPAET